MKALLLGRTAVHLMPARDIALLSQSGWRARDRKGAPIGRLIDSRQYPSKSVEIGHPLGPIEIVSADLPRRTQAGSLPDLMFAAGFFIIDGLRRK
jgi:hypothetical protein